MSEHRKYISVESAKSSARATISRALATALITGIENARADGRPLNELQQISVATMHMMAYGDSVADAERSIDGAAIIDEFVLADSRRVS